MPLELCYAKTIHTFQGQNAGEVQPGQPPNAVKRIIVDPGTKQFEGRNPGLFYTIHSRGTTLGKDKMSSSMYFIGENMNIPRIKNITQQITGRLFKRVYERDEWVNYQKQGIHKNPFKTAEITKLFRWASETTIDKHTYEQLTLN